MRRQTSLAVLAAAVATLVGAACAAPTAPRQANDTSIRRDGPPAPGDSTCRTGGLIGSGTRC